MNKTCHNCCTTVKLLELKEIQQTERAILKSSQPAEIEVSPVNWILGEKNRSIPHRQAVRPPAVTALGKYNRHHRNTQQIIRPTLQHYCTQDAPEQN